MAPNTAYAFLALLAGWSLLKIYNRIRIRAQSTPLKGPFNASFLLGHQKALGGGADTGEVYENWAAEY